MANELATGYVSIVAETRGMGKAILGELGRAETAAGRSGKAMGVSLSKGIAAAKPVNLKQLEQNFTDAEKRREAAVRRTTETVEGLRRKEAIAAAQLSEAEGKYAQDSVQYLRAKDRHVTATQKLRKAEAETAVEISKCDQAVTEANDALKEYSQTQEKANSFSGKMFKGVSGAFSKVKGAFSKAARDGEAGGVETGRRFSKGLGAKMGAGAKSGASIFKASLAANLGAKAIGGALSGVKSAISGAFSGGWNRLMNIEAAKSKFKVLKMDADKTMDSVSTAVDGTRFAISDAADMASVLGATGMKAGKDMERWLKVTGDAAQFSNREFSDMQLSIQKVAQQGKVTGETFNELPVATAALATHLGKSQEEVRKLASAGKISSAEFLAAMEKQIGGMASGGGTTVASMLANIKTAWNATMANLMEGVTDRLNPVLEGLLGGFKGIRDAAKPAGEAIGVAFGWMIQKGDEAAVALGDVFGKIKRGFSGKELAGENRNDPFRQLGISARESLGPIKDAVGKVLAAVRDLGGGFLEGFGGLERLKGVATDLLPAITGPVGLLKDALKDLFTGLDFGAIGKQLGSTLGPILSSVAGLAGKVGESLSKIAAGVLPVVKDGFAKMKPSIDAVVKAFSPFVDAIKRLIGFVTPILVPAFKFLAAVLMDSLKGAIDGISWVLDGLTKTLNGIMDFISNIFTGNWTAAWEGIKNALFGVIEAIAGGIWTWMNVTVVNAVRGGIAKVAGYFTGGWASIKSIFTSALNGLKGLVSGAWNAIRGNTTAIWNGIKGFITGTWTGMKNSVLGIGNALKGGISGIWNGIKSAASTLWNGIKSVVTQAVGGLKSGVEGAFRTMSKNIGSIWDGVKAAVKAPIKFVVETVINKGLIGSFNSLINKIGLGNLAIGTVALPKGFADGGWTGPGSKYQPAGIVHADEHVWTKEEMRKFPGGHKRMEQMRAAVRRGERDFGMAGYASGGRVRAPFSGGSWNGGRYRSGKYHGGIDYPRPVGTAVRAAEDGTVIAARRMATSYGIHAIIRGVWDMIYAHMSRMIVSQGQQVRQGQTIGAVGSTGNSTGPHLHWEVRPRGGRYGSAVNPLAVASGALAGGGGVVAEESPLDKLKGMLSGAAKKIFDVGKAAVGYVTEFLKDPMGHITAMFNKVLKPSGGAGIIGQIVDAIPGKVVDALKQYAKDIIGFAGGTTSAPPGLAWVGERGPELVRFRGGERVWSNSESVRMASQPSQTQVRIELVDERIRGLIRAEVRQMKREGLVAA